MAQKRQRPPTDEQKTSIYDSKNLKHRAKSDTRKGFESGEIALPTLPDKGQTIREVTVPTPLDIGTPTHIDPPREKSEPIKVISMKTPAAIAHEKQAAKKAQQKKHHKAEIRALSDVVRRDQTPPRAMGYLAPPADPKERQVRRLRDWLIWGSVLVIISCIVMLGVWFLAT